MKSSFNLVAYFDQLTVTPEQKRTPALLRPPPALVRVEKTEVTSKLNNDRVGICPHCEGRMELSAINVARLANPMKVYVCPKDRYVAPLPDSEVQE